MCSRQLIEMDNNSINYLFFCTTSNKQRTYTLDWQEHHWNINLKGRDVFHNNICKIATWNRYPRGYSEDTGSSTDESLYTDNIGEAIGWNCIRCQNTRMLYCFFLKEILQQRWGGAVQKLFNAAVSPEQLAQYASFQWCMNGGKTLAK